MKHYLKIRINTTKKTSVLLKLNKINVDIKNILYKNDALELDILENDLKRVKKYLVSYKIDIIDETGIYKLKSEMKKNMLFIISIIFSVILFLILTNIIVKVNVIHENAELRELLTDALKERGVNSLTFKKNYDEYEAIILDIKNNYKDKIEWLEIDVDGMIINVRVEERIINNYEEETGFCHIVASKSGIIKSVSTKKGVSLVNTNDYVSKDEILISGEIKFNEEVKNNVCASGEVYAEVWYNINASVPLNYKEEIRTGKMRYNFSIKTNTSEFVILKSRVKDKQVEKKLLFKIFGISFYLEKEYEVTVTNKKYTEKDALNKGVKLIHEKLEVRGNKNDDIIDEKVLKKSINNDNLDIDMFVAIKEQIGKKISYEVELDSDTNDEKNNGNSN